MTDLLKAAKNELKICKIEPSGENKQIACEQAAEKAWGHVHRTALKTLNVEQTKEAHRVIRDRLSDIDVATRNKHHLLDQYDLLASRLHGECFYSGGCAIEVVEEGVEKAQHFVDALKRAVREAA